jgi:hypothetical protein
VIVMSIYRNIFLCIIFACFMSCDRVSEDKRIDNSLELILKCHTTATEVYYCKSRYSISGDVFLVKHSDGTFILVNPTSSSDNNFVLRPVWNSRIQLEATP